MDAPLSLSIIVCTLDRPGLLGNCMESLFTQLSEKLTVEIIVVDGSRTDETRKLMATYSARSRFVRYFFEEKKGHSAARNRGYIESSGEYLIYLDDDAILPADYMENVIQVIRMHTPDILGGPVYPYYTTPKPWWFSDEFEIRKYENQSGFSSHCGISGGNFIIRKRILEKLGLFDPSYGMSDGKLGMLDERKVLDAYRFQTPPESQKVYYSLECYIFHFTPEYKMRLSYMLKRSFVAGGSQFRMYLEVTGIPDHGKGGQLVWRGILNLIYDIPRMVIKRHVSSRKYINICIDGLTRISKGLGYFAAQVKFLVKGTASSRNSQ